LRARSPSPNNPTPLFPHPFSSFFRLGAAKAAFYFHPAVKPAFLERGETYLNPQIPNRNMETQTPTQNPENPAQNPALQLRIFTWGSCRRGNAYVIDIESGKRFDLYYYTQRSGEGELRLPILHGRFLNEDSNKNLHRTVYIHGSTRPVVVRYFGRESCNPKSAFDEAWLIIGSTITTLEIKREVVEEVVDNGSERYRAAFDVTYVETPYGRVVLDKNFKHAIETLEVTKIPLEIAYSSQKKRLVVSGKTYHVKDMLKKMGFRWDGAYWYRDAVDVEEAKRVVEELKKIEKVVIERELWL
jgi:hypothetical protein